MQLKFKIKICVMFLWRFFSGICGKEEEKKSIYMAPFILRVVSKCSDKYHTALPANYTMRAFPL